MNNINTMLYGGTAKTRLKEAKDFLKQYREKLSPKQMKELELLYTDGMYSRVLARLEVINRINNITK